MQLFLPRRHFEDQLSVNPDGRDGGRSSQGLGDFGVPGGACKGLGYDLFHPDLFTKGRCHGLDQTGHVIAGDSVLTFMQDLKINGFHFDLKFKKVQANETKMHTQGPRLDQREKVQQREPHCI